MKLLLLSSNIGLFGAEGVVLNLIKGLPASVRPLLGNFFNRHNPHTELADAVTELGYPVRQINCGGAFDPLALQRLSQIIKEEKIDLIHSHGYKSDFYGFGAAKITRRPILSTLHSTNSETARLGLYVKLQKFLFRYFNYVVCVSDKLRQELLKPPILPQKMAVIDNGVDIASFTKKPGAKKELAHYWNLPQEGIYVGVAGRLSSEKGFDLFLRAAQKIAQKHPTAYFLIAGEGTEESKLKELTQELQLEERVKFLGLVENMNDFFSALDIFVLSSLTEGLPLVILEAMAAGLPVIATRVGAVNRVIEDGKTGILVEPGDVPALVAALKRFLKDRDTAGKMGQEAVRIIEEKFSAQAMAVEYFAIYQNILREREAGN